LLDAVGRTLISLDHASKEYLPDKCIVVIVTDGKENASREFRREQIKQMIEAREESGKWTFIYLGADVSTFSEAGSLGIQLMNTARFINTAGGSVQLYATTSERIAALRMGAKDAGLGGVIPEAPEPSQVQRAEDSKLRSDASQGRPPGSKDDSQ
jgi:hypothetical protein